MNDGDSVNESEIADVDATVLKFKDMSPPTCTRVKQASLKGSGYDAHLYPIIQRNPRPLTCYGSTPAVVDQALCVLNRARN